jgi:hypothetical protein
MGWARSPVRILARYTGTTKQGRRYSAEDQKKINQAGRRSRMAKAAIDYAPDLLNFGKF